MGRVIQNPDTGLEVEIFADGSITLDRPAFTNCSDSLAFAMDPDEAAWLYTVIAGSVPM